ncbi:unnamed protein product [Urochloa decumbens]|uniref:4-hydroxyphenylacetaldehyde oxime monooxygenase n=1 Tax=Urochloa decumbens TaxID=240449 RepID=A0ABC8Y3J4_9POAL
MATPSQLLAGLPQQWQVGLLALLPVLLLCLSSYLLLRSRGTLRLPPGPAQLPVLGNLHLLGPLPHRSLRDLARRHGPVMQLRLGTVPAVVVSSPAAAREVMKTHDADCCSRPDTPGARRMSYGLKDVAFAPYDQYWREMRKLFTVELLGMRGVKAAWHARERQVDKLIADLTRLSVVALDEHIFGLADGIVGTVAFGNVHGTERFAHTFGRFQHVLDEAMDMMASFSAEDFFPGAAGRLADRVTGGEGRRRPQLVDVLVGLMNQQRFSREHVKGIIMDPFIGGIDTTSVTMLWAMSELVRHPRVLSKAQHEVRAACSNNRARVEPDDVPKLPVDTSSVTMVWAMAELIRRPAMLRKVQEEIRATVGADKARVHHDDMPKLRYLKMVVKETLRLHPAVPLLLPRETMRHVTICGYDVPAKTRVLVNAWAIGRDPASWGPNAEEFDPDRFQGRSDAVDYNGAHFELVPFGAGRRICPGLAMGETNVMFTLASLLYCFDWALPEGMTPDDVSMEEAGGLTFHRKTPLLLVPARWYQQQHVSTE